MGDGASLRMRRLQMGRGLVLQFRPRAASPRQELLVPVVLVLIWRLVLV